MSSSSSSSTHGRHDAVIQAAKAKKAKKRWDVLNKPNKFHNQYHMKTHHVTAAPEPVSFKALGCPEHVKLQAAEHRENNLSEKEAAAEENTFMKSAVDVTRAEPRLRESAHTSHTNTRSRRQSFDHSGLGENSRRGSLDKSGDASAEYLHPIPQTPPMRFSFARDGGTPAKNPLKGEDHSGGEGAQATPSKDGIMWKSGRGSQEATPEYGALKRGSLESTPVKDGWKRGSQDSTPVKDAFTVDMAHPEASPRKRRLFQEDSLNDDTRPLAEQRVASFYRSSRHHLGGNAANWLKTESKSRIFMYRAVHSILIFSMMIHLRMCRMVVAGLYCLQYPDEDVWRLRADYSVICWEGEHAVAAAMFVFTAIFFVVGYPFYCWYLLTHGFKSNPEIPLTITTRRRGIIDYQCSPSILLLLVSRPSPRMSSFNFL
jgi:hypothetical protein